MSRKRNWTDQQLRQAVGVSHSVAQVLSALGLQANGGNYKSFYHHCNRLGLDYNHFTGQGHLKGRTHHWKPRIPLQEVMVADSSYRNLTSLKKRIVESGLIDYVCSECGQEPIWNNKPLVLILDHINGINNDHRLENLRFLCPNCNAQQPTFAGRNKGKASPRGIEPRSLV